MQQAHFNATGSINRHEPESWDSTAWAPCAFALASDAVDYGAIDRAGGSVISTPRRIEGCVIQKSKVGDIATVLRRARAATNMCPAGHLGAGGSTW
jgi:hypothetical protein